MIANPAMSTYVAGGAVAAWTWSGSRWLTLRGKRSPFMPVARTMKSYVPGANVPVLIVSVARAPVDVGVTVVELNEIGPMPVRAGAPMPLARTGSTLSDTGPPNAVLVGWFWRVRSNVTASPAFVAVRACTSDVKRK